MGTCPKCKRKMIGGKCPSCAGSPPGKPKPGVPVKGKKKPTGKPLWK